MQHVYEVDFTKITDVEVAGIDMADYPDFCDAYVEYCLIDGVEATDEQLDTINDNPEFVYEEVINYLH